MFSNFTIKYFKVLTTIECTAPILAQANMAITNSRIIGMYMATRSPLVTPLDLRTFAKRHTSSNNFR